MEEILLSICISSYNRGYKCKQLVERLLSIKDDRFNIFICDDHSNKETVLSLKTLISSKVMLVLNEMNIGPCCNWFKTINSGNGKYILHILDRDDINVSYLPMILNILEKNPVGGGYFGRSAISPAEGLKKQISFAICQKGKQAFLTMGVPVHPTGFCIERKEWIIGNYKRFFYESNKYGIYPHSYVLGITAIKRNMIFSPIPFYEYMYRFDNLRSGFYAKNIKRDYWWMPADVIKTNNSLILYLSRFADISYKEEFVSRMFRHGLYRATISYKKVVANQEEMGRYGFQIKNASFWELLLISLKYRIIFSFILDKLDMKDKNCKKVINKIWLENIREIIKEG